MIFGPLFHFCEAILAVHVINQELKCDFVIDSIDSSSINNY
jgi:hypothetical protein